MLSVFRTKNVGNTGLSTPQHATLPTDLKWNHLLSTVFLCVVIGQTKRCCNATQICQTQMRTTNPNPTVPNDIYIVKTLTTRFTQTGASMPPQNNKHRTTKYHKEPTNMQDNTGTCYLFFVRRTLAKRDCKRHNTRHCPLI